MKKVHVNAGCWVTANNRFYRIWMHHGNQLHPPIAQQKIPYSLNQYTQRCYFSSLISNIYMIYYLQWVLD